MADITHNLMIKFGLSRRPTQEESDRWVATTNVLISQGYTREEAGRRAAVQILPGVGTKFYASEADTIDTLLDKAKDK